MKAVLAVSLPNELAGEFTNLIRRFDEAHQGCVFQIFADHALPRDLRPLFDRIVPWAPVIDPRKWDFGSD
jgi:hypothetical protein